MNSFTVIYIIGDQRSGSTLLDYLLSWHPKATSVGELALLNSHYFRTTPQKMTDWSCHCGEYVDECSFWKDITAQVGFSKEFETRIKYKESLLSYLSFKNQRKDLTKFLRSENIEKKAKKIADDYWKLYEAIHKQTGKSIIIDSSKNGILAYFLNKHRNGNIRFILLEREIEAVAFSKLGRAKIIAEKDKKSLTKPYLYYLLGSGYKMILNRLLARLIDEENNFKTYVEVVDYMKLVQNTQKIIDQITTTFQIGSFVSPTFTNEERTEKVHAIAGSPGHKQRCEIKPDLKHKSYLDKNKFINLLTKLICTRYYSQKNTIDLKEL